MTTQETITHNGRQWTLSGGIFTPVCEVADCDFTVHGGYHWERAFC